MSAERLREAARLMRERAKAALPRTRGLCDDWFEVGAPALDHLMHTEQRHIASWHPAIALAVADWLEATADHADATGGHCVCDDAALAVANAYLGADQ